MSPGSVSGASHTSIMKSGPWECPRAFPVGPEPAAQTGLVHLAGIDGAVLGAGAARRDTADESARSTL